MMHGAAKDVAKREYPHRDGGHVEKITDYDLAPPNQLVSAKQQQKQHYPDGVHLFL